MKALIVILLICFNIINGFVFIGSKVGFISRISRKSSLQPTEPPKIELVPYSGVGCVLLSKPEEKVRFCSNAAVLIYSTAQNRTYGVVLDKASAFDIGQTSPIINVFSANWLFLGGNEGSDLASMFHSYDFGIYSKKVCEGVYLGGMEQAKQLLAEFKTTPKHFKFIFNNLEWEAGKLENEINDGRWDVCRLPSDLILSQDRSTGHIWSTARAELFKSQ